MPNDPLPDLAARSDDEVTATWLYWAPDWIRALRDITIADTFAGPYDAAADTPVLRSGEVAAMRITGSGTVVVTVAGTDHHFGSWQLRHHRPDSHAPGREILQLISGTEHTELLLEQGSWTLPDGLVIHIDRERGLWADR